MMQSRDIIIRKAETADFTSVAELERLCFSKPWSLEELLESNSLDCEFFVLETEGVIAAYGGMQISDGAYVTNIACHPDFRRQGFGKKTVEALIAYSKEKALEFITLEVRASNEGAIRLYEGLGFEKIGKRPNFYSHPREDAFIYTLFLGD